MFFFAIRHEHRKEVLEIFEQYDKEKYIVGFETSHRDTLKETDGEHIHFYCLAPDKTYNAFSKRLIERFNLRRKAVKGQERQFGKDRRDVQSLERMKAYTLKDGDFVTNMTQGEIDKLVEISFRRTTRLDFADKVYANLRALSDSFQGDYYYNGEYIMRLKDEVLMTHIREDIRADVSQNILDRYIRMFIMYHSSMNPYERVRFIQNYFLR